VRSGEAVKPPPFVEFGLDIPFVNEELIEFLLIGTVRALKVSVKLWGVALDVSVSNAFVFNMPIEFDLELVVMVSSHIVA
jgi:hypothetical protein